MKFNFMKSKIFVVLSILLFVEILFCITGCKDLLISQNAAKTSININLDLSKLIKTSRNQTSQEVTDYLLKIEAYNAENYQENAEVENLPLLTQAKSKVDVSGLVKVTLEVPIDSNVILVAKLHKIIDENTESEKPLYKGKSEIFKVKESDNKIHLVLTKTNSDLDIDISLNTQSTYKVEHYQQNIEDDSYTLVESDSENKTGTIGTNTEAVAKSYEGFSVNPFDQQKIFSDGSTTVKIYYTRNVYTVTFNANGGSLKDDASQKVKYGETPAEPTPPEKEGYNFGYWYTSKDNGVTEDVSYNFSTTVTNDVTLYAMWIAGSDIIYKVEHYQQNIEDDEYSLVEVDTESKTGTIGTETQAVAKNYVGFSVNPFEQKPILADGSTTVKIYYTRNVYTVIFNANGGSLKDDASQKVKYGETPAEPIPPEKEGYNFGYWYTSKDNGVTEDISYNFSTTVTNDVTLYAMWIAGSDIVYKVEHYKQNIEDDNYTLVESDSENKTGTIGTNTEAVAKSYEGFSVNPFEQKPILADGSTTVKIYYTRNINTVTFNANGGSLKDDASQKVKYGETPAEPTPPEKEGYNFGYWYTSKDNGVTEDVSYNFSTTVTNNVTLYAMWIAGTDIVYKVEHYQQNIEDDEYSLVEADTETKKGTIGTQTEATAKSYEGFSVNPFEQKTILSNGSTTVKIYYTRNVYTVTFNANGGILSENSSQIVKYNGKSTEPTEPTKSEYFFDGWYISSIDGTTLESKFDFSAPITSDITLYAKWIEQTEISYTVEHYQQNIDDDNYSLVSSEIKTRKTGEQIQAIPNEYYGFSVKTISQETLIEDGSSLIKIYYDRNLYTVTFNANGGTLLTDSTQYVKYEGTAKQPTLEGTSLYGWYKTNNITEMMNSIPFDFSTPITQDTSLFAKWDFVYVKGAVIDGTIKASGYTESEIFKEGGIVSIPNFYISDHEVTQAEYKAIMGNWPDESVVDVEQIGVGDNYPVYYVNWFDTLVYCNKRSMKENLTPCYTIDGSTNPDEWGDVPDSENHENFKTWFNASCNFQADGYRLPTDAEWEYAARGGNELKGFQYQYAGSNSIDMVAWCSENSSGTSHEVKLKQPNELGLYDMSGNLWEWCWDDSASDDLIYHRKNRGGNWYDGTDGCMLSYRNNYYSYDRMSNIGFRLVRTATSQSQGDVYSQGISLNGKIYDKTSEVVVVPKGTVAKIEMEDDRSWNTYYEGDDQNCKGVFLKDRKVQLSPFAIGQFEVTQELYEAVFDWNPSNFQTYVADGEIQNLRPVECITWYDAVNFCNELTKLTMGENHCVYTITSISYDETNSYITDATVSLDISKKGYRLPTEAEWEFAARGGDPTSEVWKYAYAGVQKTTDPFEIIDGKEATVDSILENYSWELNNSADNTHEVGKKLPNTLNIYDMVGNVKELCNDWFSENISLENVENPIGADYGTVKIEKGGSYLSTLWWCVISIRDETLPTTREKDLGFRIVRTITE